VTRRTNEIGVRMALGATASRITWMVLADALWMVGAGLALGALMVVWSRPIATRLVEDLRVSIGPQMASVVAVVVAVAVLTACVPARRAARVDPMQALRHE
jgi:ABC-type antimicrobial peptide transport system permease subunit